MSLSVTLDSARVMLHPDKIFQLTGALQCEEGQVELLTGENGSGKTMLLSTLSFIFEHPVLGSIKGVERSKITTSIARPIRKVSVVRQEPHYNYVGSEISDEIRLVFADSQYSSESFRSEIVKLLRNEFDIHENLLSRLPSQLSSGEKQVLAVALAILTKPDLVLLDEPLARLSRKFAAKAIRFLKNHASGKYVLMSLHTTDEEILLSDEETITRQYQTERVNRNISVKTRQVKKMKESVQELLHQSELFSSLFISSDSFKAERERSENFDELPQNGVRCIHGTGEPFTDDEIDIKIISGKDVITSAGPMKVHEGINLLYGDNGAGKTLIARFMAGDFSINPTFKFLRRIYAEGTIPDLNTQAIGDLPPKSNIKRLRSNVNSFFLPAEPESFVAERTVRKEIESVYSGQEAEERFELLAQLGIDAESPRAELSYGQQKVLAFASLPKSLALAILDEPFANLSDTFQKKLAEFILERVRMRDWYVTIITTNRPIRTVLSLRLGIPD